MLSSNCLITCQRNYSSAWHHHPVLYCFRNVHFQRSLPAASAATHDGNNFRKSSSQMWGQLQVVSKGVLLLQPHTQRQLKCFPSVPWVYYLFGEPNDDDSGWQGGLVVTGTLTSCKGQRFNCSNSRTFWLKAFQQDAETIHSVIGSHWIWLPDTC